MDLNMDFADDDEVILEGGELHTHIQNNSPHEPYLHSPKSEDKINDEWELADSTMKVSDETKSVIDYILQKTALLEEDAQYLFSFGTTLKKRHCLNMKAVICIICLIIGVCFSFILDSLEFTVVFSLILGCTTLSYMRSIFTFHKLNANIKGICNIIDSHIPIRKRYNFIYTQTVWLSTKEFKFKSKFPKNDITDEFKKEKENIQIICKDFLKFLIDIIKKTKYLTLVLLDYTEPKLPLHFKNLIATKNYDEIGLTVNDDFMYETVDIENIMIKMHLLILLQSEFLSLLGYSICKLENNKYIKELVNKYYKFLKVMDLKNEDIPLKLMKNVINDTFTRETKEINSSDKQIIEKVNIMMNDLYTTTFDLSSIVNLISKNEVDSENISETFKSIESNLIFINDNFSQIKGCWEKNLRLNTKLDNIEKLSPTQNMEDLQKVAIQVGTSDFSVKSEDDNIYLHVPVKDVLNTETDDLEDNSCEVDEHVKETYHMILIEMNDILIKKRKELELREEQLMKKDPNYKAFTDNVDEEVEESKEDDTEELHPEQLPQMDSEFFDLHREITMKFREKISQWKDDSGTLDQEWTDLSGEEMLSSEEIEEEVEE